MNKETVEQAMDTIKPKFKETLDTILALQSIRNMIESTETRFKSTVPESYDYEDIALSLKFACNQIDKLITKIVTKTLVFEFPTLDVSIRKMDQGQKVDKAKRKGPRYKPYKKVPFLTKRHKKLTPK